MRCVYVCLCLCVWGLSPCSFEHRLRLKGMCVCVNTIETRAVFTHWSVLSAPKFFARSSFIVCFMRAAHTPGMNVIKNRKARDEWMCVLG